MAELAGAARQPEIAVVGMAGRFPGAGDLTEFWENLAAGTESLTTFSDEELRSAGVDSASLADPHYVPVRGILEGVDLFDAAYFGFTPREAEILDPQHRLFLECATAALEDSGHDPGRSSSSVGLFAGTGTNSYLLSNLLGHRAHLERVGDYQVMLGSDSDFLATRAAYLLNLRGPSLTVQTACSTSLVAVHLAVQSLLNGETDLALAGGVRVSVPQRAGYLFRDGGVLSPDGHCRAFDAAARGCVPGDGVGVVVLRRLADALADGDTVRAVILATAVNNDGALKAGFTAPSVEGQAEVVAMTHALAGVDPRSISYVEAHGTGTPLGDPIEIAALKQAFAGCRDSGFCAVGSVKTAIGHLDAAAGVAGLIKTVLALEHRKLPPSLHFERPHPDLSLEESPFYVCTALRDWRAAPPRRAGVSSFGIGGTNAHVLLEEPPPRQERNPERPAQLLVLSARSAAALEEVTRNLAAHLRRHPTVELADVAFTLQAGRRRCDHRRTVVTAGVAEAASALDSLDPAQVLTRVDEGGTRPVVFTFPGQGSQYPGMGRGLYEVEPRFSATIDHCAELLTPLLGSDLREVLFPTPAQAGRAARRLAQTELAQPALFAVEYALARLWMEWGLSPAAMIGHSIGEYVAACLAGVLPLADALAVVAERGRLMQGLPAGAMLAVDLSEEGLCERLTGGLALAAVNGSRLCTVAGPVAAIEAFAERLAEEGVGNRRIPVSHAFHSPMMNPILPRFEAALRRLRLAAPSLRWVSNLTGSWIRPEEASDPGYWVEHLRRPVRFAAGLAELLRDSRTIFLEVGPSTALTSLARRHADRGAGHLMIASSRHPKESAGDWPHLLKTAGQLWLAGVELDWPEIEPGRRRVPLPSYPFQRRRFWIDRRAGAVLAAGGDAERRCALDHWFYVPVWRQTAPRLAPKAPRGGVRWLFFADRTGLAERVASLLAEQGAEVVTVHPGDGFIHHGGGEYTIAPGRAQDYRALVGLAAPGASGLAAAHFWGVTPQSPPAAPEAIEEAVFFSSLWLAQALAETPGEQPLELSLVTSHAHRITGGEPIEPEKALALGPCTVIPQEIPRMRCRWLDVSPLEADPRHLDRLAEQVAAELTGGGEEVVVASRAGVRWVRGFERLALPPAAGTPPRLRQRGAYLVTGGFGGLGFELARHLACEVQARLTLVGRTPPPDPAVDGADPRCAQVRELESLGSEVLALAADVADEAQIRIAVERARERFGPLDGVVHAAGVAGGGALLLKSREAAAAVLAPKVRGTRALVEALAKEPPDFVLLCASLSGVLGGPGQVDYCAANAVLDAFAHRGMGETAVIAVDWDAWREVGMAARAAARAAESAAMAAGSDSGHPLLGQRLADGDGATFACVLDPTHQWVLAEHRLGGQPVVPGTAYLEMGRAAFERLAGEGAVELRDVLFLKPMLVRDDERREVQTVLERRSAESYGFEIKSRPVEQRGSWERHAVGTVRRLLGGGGTAASVAELLARCQAGEEAMGESYREGLREAGLGARWEPLDKVYLGHGEAVARLCLGEEFLADLEQFKLHPALLDVATSFPEKYLDLAGYFLPLTYDSVRILAPLARTIYSHARFGAESSGKETVRYDLRLLDEGGRSLVEVEGFALKRVADVASTIRSYAETDTESAPPEAGGATARQGEVDLTDAILIREGIEVFDRLLSISPQPQVLVSTRDFEAVRAAVDEGVERLRLGAAAGDAEAEVHARPQLAIPFAAPRGDTEERIAAIWQEVVGVEPVGRDDDFFELGGHSLLATQVVSRLRLAFGQEVAIGALFEAPSVARLAALLEAQRGEGTAAGGPIPQADRGGPLPLSYAQERLWFLDQLDPGSPTYNISHAIAMRGRVVVEALAVCLITIAERHEILRTTFAADTDGSPVQRVQPSRPRALPVIDLSALPSAPRETVLERLGGAAAARSFDLATGPLWGAWLVRAEAERWVFLLCFHHVVADGWSVALFTRELAALYEARLRGETARLQDLPIQYGDFAVWQRRQLGQETLDREIAYWVEALEGSPPALLLPTDRPRPRQQSFQGANLFFTLSAERTVELKRLARKEGATLFMTLLAALQILLHRLSGQDDIVVGSPIAGRDRAELEDLIGIFLNNLVFRTHLDGDPSFRDLLGRVRQTAVEAFEHHNVPFERLLEHLQVRRDLGRTPVFQVLFNMQDFPRHRLEVPGLSLESLRPRDVASKFDLTFYAAEIEEEILVEVVYNADLFDTARIDHLSEQLVALLEQVGDNPDWPISSYTLLGVAARRLLPDPRALLDEPPFPSVGQVFLDLARSFPERLALVADEGVWTYAELARRALGVYARLRRSGLGRGTVTAVTGPRCPDLIAAILGVLLSPAVLLTLDPRLPTRRRRAMLQLTEARFILAAGDEVPAKEPETELIAVGGADPGDGAESRGHLSTPEPDDPCYVFFTSGTTGGPKGILGCHKGLAHFLAWQRASFGVGAADRSAQLTGLSFDVVLRDVLLPLTSGAVLCLPPGDDLGADRIVPWLERHCVTLLHMVPSLAETWLMAEPEGGWLPSLRYTFFAGEPLSSALVVRWRQAFPSGALINLYGPTETTLAKCFWVVPDPPPPGVQPIGRPLPQTQALVLAAGDRLCGVGEPGEIVLRTPFRSLGYLGGDGSEASRFRPSPFTGSREDLLYFSGDGGRFRPDGSLEILGRLDDQVKVRGMRVEPAETKAALERQPDVRACEVLALPEASGGWRLVAYVVAASDSFDPAHLRQRLAEELPGALVPVAFVAIEALPLTANGKVDREMLRSINGVEPPEATEPLAPRNAVEEKVAELWREVLAVNRVGIRDHFFDLGGHSLLALQLVTRLRRDFAVDLPVRSLFEEPTVEGLARRVEACLGAGEAAGAPPLCPRPRDLEPPLSYAQQRQWFLVQLEPSSPAFNLPRAVRLLGHLRGDLLERAVAEIVRRHEALRTTFPDAEGRPRQVIAPTLRLPLPVVDLAALPAAPRRRQAERLIQVEGSRPFDLTLGPLLRLFLVRLGDAEHVAHVTMHHIVSDAWSLGVFIEELAELYGALAAGAPVPLPPLPLQYADFAHWQRQWLQSEVLNTEILYWRRKLAGAPLALELPTDRSPERSQAFAGGRLPLGFDSQRTAAVRELARSEEATVFIVLLAALKVVLGHRSGQHDLVVGAPVAGRERPELEGLIGYFINALALRTDLSGDPAFREVVRRVRETVLEGYAHQDVPFDKLVEELRPKRLPGRFPFFQVVFNYYNGPVPRFELPDLALRPVDTTIETSKYDLTLYLAPEGDGLAGSLVYHTGLFSAAAAEGLRGDLETVLAVGTLQPDLPLQEIGRRLGLGRRSSPDARARPLRGLAGARRKAVVYEEMGPGEEP